MVSATVYNSCKNKLMTGSFNLTSDTIKVALLTSSYTPNIDTHIFFSDLTNEVTSANYTTGGATLGSTVITTDTSGDFAWFDAADTTWSTVTFTYRYIVCYKSTGTASTSPLMFYIDLGTDHSNAGDTAYIQWATTGLFKIA